MDIYSYLVNSSVYRYCQTLDLLKSPNTLTKDHKIKSNLEYVLTRLCMQSSDNASGGIIQNNECKSLTCKVLLPLLFIYH